MLECGYLFLDNEMEITTDTNVNGEPVAIISQQFNQMTAPQVVELTSVQLREALEMVTGIKWSPEIGEIGY